MMKPRHFTVSLATQLFAAAVLISLLGGLIGRQAIADDVPPRTPLATRVLQSKESFQPIDPERVAASRKRLMKALAVLEADVKSDGPRKEAGWKSYLMWDELTAEMKKPEPDIRVLQEAGSKLVGTHPGLERRAMVGARTAIKEFVILEFYSRDELLQERFEALLDRLADDIDAQEQAPTSEAAHRIGVAIGFLESAGQTPELVRELRDEYSEPNLVVRFSSSFFKRALNRPVLNYGVVAQNILGTEVRGTSKTTGRVCIFPVESDDDALFEICLEGNVFSDTIGRNGPATICSISNADVAAWRCFTFDGDDFVAGPVQAVAESHTIITGLSTKPRFIRNFAMKRAMKTKPAAERVASGRTRRQVADGFEEETDELMVDLKRRYVENVFQPLKRADQSPQFFDVSTAHDSATIEWLQANYQQLGAGQSPPAVKVEGDVVARVHESALRNAAESILGGRTFDRAKFEELSSKLMPLKGINKPEAGEADGEEPGVVEEDEEDFTVTFEPSLPVLVDFRDDRVTIAVNIRRFQRADQSETLRVRLQVAYDISISGDGIWLKRVGEPNVTFPGSQRLSVRQLTLKTFILKRIEESVPENIKTVGFIPPESMPQLSALGKFSVVEANAVDGWLCLGWNAGK